MKCTCQNIQFDTKHDMFWTFFYDLILPVKAITLTLTFDLSTHLNYIAKCVFGIIDYYHTYFDDFIEL